MLCKVTKNKTERVPRACPPCPRAKQSTLCRCASALGEGGSASSFSLRDRGAWRKKEGGERANLVTACFKGLTIGQKHMLVQIMVLAVLADKSF